MYYTVYSGHVSALSRYAVIIQLARITSMFKRWKGITSDSSGVTILKFKILIWTCIGQIVNFRSVGDVNTWYDVQFSVGIILFKIAT